MKIWTLLRVVAFLLLSFVWIVYNQAENQQTVQNSVLLEMPIKTYVAFSNDDGQTWITWNALNYGNGRVVIPDFGYSNDYGHTWTITK